MKKLILFLAFLFASITFSVNEVNAASIATTAVNSVSVTTTIPEKVVNQKKVVKKSAWYRLTHPVETLRTGDDNKDVIFYVLCILLGPLGIHRVVMGAKPIMILWYILAGLGLALVYLLLSILTFFLLAWIGWIIIFALPLFDLITALVSGTSYFQGNDDVFAGFKGLGSKKK